MQKLNINFSLSADAGLTHIQAALEPTVNGVLLTLTDTTEQRQHELRNLLQQTTHAIWALTAALAHEINNPLTALFNNADYVRQILSQDAALSPELASAFDDIHAGLHSIHRLIAQSRGHSGGCPQSLDTSEIKHILKLCTSSIRLQSAALIQADLSAIPDDIHVHCSAPQLYSLFLNLLQNAVQSFGRSAIQSGRAAILLRAHYRADHRKVCIQIQDNGPGIPPPYKPFIFDPGFSTDPFSRAGLGLSLCQKIVQDLGETLQVDSTLTEGTCVTFCAPCIGAPPTP